MKPECIALKQDYQYQLQTQWKHPPLQTQLVMQLRLYHGTKRKADIDNFCKLILDALTDIVYVDDDQIIDLRITKHYDKTRPRAEIKIATV